MSVYGTTKVKTIKERTLNSFKSLSTKTHFLLFTVQRPFGNGMSRHNLPTSRFLKLNIVDVLHSLT